MTTRLCSLIACASVAAVSAAGPPTDQAPTCSVPASTRTVPGYFYATLVMIDNAAPQDYMALLLQTLGQVFQPTAPTDLPAFVVTDSVGTGAGYVSARFTVTDVGRVRDVSLVTSSLSPALDQSLLAALTAIDTAGLVPPFPDRMHGHRTFELELDVGAVTIAQLQQHDGSFGVIMPWAATAIPAWDDAEPARPPHYSDVDKNTRVLRGDGSPMRFVVGRDGHVIQQAAEILPQNSDSQESLELRTEVLPRMARAAQYQPATIGGCPVQAIVRSKIAIRRFRHE
jgi:TonB family protein